MKHAAIIGMLAVSCVLSGANNGHAAKWVKNANDNPMIEATYHDANSVKVVKEVLRWTEKTVVAKDKLKAYQNNLAKYEVCKQNMDQYGEVTHHQIDYEIKKGQFRRVAKRNYNNDNKLICTDKDMGKDYDKTWHPITRRSPIEETYFHLVTKYKIPDL